MMAVESPERVAAAVPSAEMPTRRQGRALALLVPLVLLATAGTLRFYRLDQPRRCYFDETYYYYDAREYLDQGVERGFAVHPPIGKWMIAGGLALFGVPEGSPLDQAVTEDPGSCPNSQQHENPPARAREDAEAFARRFSSALVGTLGVGVAYLTGLRLFRRRGIAALGALLLAVDGLAFTISRIAMLDVFLGFWVLVGFWLLLVDRDRQWAGVPEPGTVALDDDADARPLPRRPHWARWLAGVAFGLALATKWSAGLAITAAGLFVLASELAWRRRLTGRFWVKPHRLVASGLLTLVAVPAVVYALSYLPWFVNFAQTRPGQEPCPAEGCPTALPAIVEHRVRAWAGEQAEIYRFHRDLNAEHPYRAPATTWLLLTRPVAYYYEDCTARKVAEDQPCRVAEGHVAEILGIGNPAIWWMALPSYLVLLWAALRRRRWAAWAILAFVALQYLPWLAAPRPVFLFYATPLVPFVCFTVAYAAAQATRGRWLGWIPAAVAVLALVSFLFWYPMLSGLEIPKGSWDLRMWFHPGWI